MIRAAHLFHNNDNILEENNRRPKTEPCGMSLIYSVSLSTMQTVPIKSSKQYILKWD